MWQEHYAIDEKAKEMLEDSYSVDEIIDYLYGDGWDSNAIKQTLLDTKKFSEEEIDKIL